jgi:hypothetical protein
MKDRLMSMGSMLIQLADKAKTAATSMASSAAASAAASTSQAVMSRLALRDADKAKQQAQQAMRALQGSSSSTGFDDPFTLHRARAKTMSFGNPFQTVGSKEFGETNAMDAFLESMQEGDANKVSNALKRLAETASPDYAQEKSGASAPQTRSSRTSTGTSRRSRTHGEDPELNVLKKRLAQSKARQLATARSKAKAKPLGSEATITVADSQLDASKTKQKATAKSKARAAPSRASFSRRHQDGVQGSTSESEREQPSFRELAKRQRERRGAGKRLSMCPRPSWSISMSRTTTT